MTQTHEMTTMRKPRLPPDTRPSWRDPNLPCIRRYRMSDGTTRTDVDPDYERRYREMLVSTPDPAQPNHTDDPTYNLRRKK